MKGAAMGFRAAVLRIAIVLALGTTLLAAPGGPVASAASEPLTTEIPIVGALGEPNRFSSETPPNAIDGDPGTFTWTTPSNTTVRPAYLDFDFGTSTVVEMFRITKGSGYGPHNLIIQYSTGLNSLPSRPWTNVSGLENGFLGADLMDAASVNTDGTVTTDAHNGTAALTFDPVQATGLRIGFDSTGDPFNHYQVYEFDAFSVDYPPTTTIELDPENPDGAAGYYVSDVHVTVASPDADALEIRCVLDPAEPPLEFADFDAGCDFLATGADITAEGEHTLYAMTQDFAGLESDVEFTSVRIDTTAPDAPVITGSTPQTPSNDRTPVIEGTAEPGSSINLFGGPSCNESFASPNADGSGDWSFELTNDLPTNSEIDFSAKATDPAGNESACSSPFTYETDNAAPSAEILEYAALTSDTTPEFQFSANEMNTSFECSIVAQGESAAFAPCSNPHTSPNALDDGDYTFALRSTDVAGNTGDPDTADFTVDTTGPIVSVTQPSDDTISTNDDVTFTFSSDETSTFECALDEAPFDECTTATDTGGTFATTDLSEAEHTFRVRATDQAGNANTAIRSYTVDTTLPQPPVINTPTSPSSDTTPTITGTAEPGSFPKIWTGNTPCDVPDGYLADVGEVAEDGTWSYTVTSPLSDGSTTRFSATTYDGAGNPSGCSNQVTYVVDTTAPAVSITDPDTDGTTTGRGFLFTYTVSDDPFPDCSIDLADPTAPCDSTTSHEVTGLSAGAHTFRVKACDTAGNCTTSARMFTVDAQGPTIEVTKAPKKKTTKRVAKIIFTAGDATTVVCRLDGVVVDCQSGVEYVSPKLSFGRHTFDITATDAHGNPTDAPQIVWKVIRK